MLKELIEKKIVYKVIGTVGGALCVIGFIDDWTATLLSFAGIVCLIAAFKLKELDLD